MSAPFPVALVTMPLAPARGPSIQLAILRALAVDAGFPVREHYFNVEFLARLHARGLAAAYDTALPPLVGEWLFAEHADAADALGEPDPDDEHDVARRLQHAARAGGGTAADLAALKRELVPPFLDACAAAILAAGSRAVCFSVSYPQVMASLAVARRLKDAQPEVRVVLGGATSQVHAASARELLRVFPFLDAIVVGEAEPVFIPLLQRLMRGASLRGLPGVVSRTRRGISGPGEPAVTPDLRRVPVPDYRGFLEMLARQPEGVRALVRPELPVEFGRGCVWGQKKPCRFCGFYPLGGFRQKPPEQVLAELQELRSQTGWNAFLVMDAAVTSAQVRRLFPSLTGTPPPCTFHFLQVRPHLERNQVELMARAGVRLLQPGIECLETRLLQRVAKGTHVFHNLLLLKWCAELGLGVSYNLLLPIPGATEEELREQLRILEAVPHLPPPYPMQLVLVRGSGYRRRPRDHGLGALQPDPFYAHLFPPGTQVRNLAYQFVETRPRRLHGGVQDATVRAIQRWQRWAALPSPPRLEFHADHSGSARLLDQRNPSRPVLEEPLLPRDAAAYGALMDRALTREAWQQQGGDMARLEEWLERGWVLESQGRCLALATRPRA